jgi:hypothetical protein
VNLFYKTFGRYPEGWKSPEVIPSNLKSLKLWNLVSDQFRVGMGGAFALDLGAIATVFKALNIDNLELELRKMKEIFRVLFENKK